MGCTNQAGEDNRNVARMGLLLAGLPVEVPGVTVNRLCASGLEAVNQAARADPARRRRPAAGRRRRVDDAARRSRCRSPTARSRAADRPSTTRRSAGASSNPRMEELHSTESMGETAENVAERYGVVARRPGRVRAREPPPRAGRAARPAASTTRSCPVPVPQPKGDPVIVHADEGPRADTTLEKLAQPAARLPRGRHRHRRQLLAAQRRRGLPRARQAPSARASSGSEPLARIVVGRRRRRRPRATWASARSRRRARRSTARA